jgi:hypothetical protein
MRPNGACSLGGPILLHAQNSPSEGDIDQTKRISSF